MPAVHSKEDCMEALIFDTHAHYDAEAFDEDRDEMLARLPEKQCSAPLG